MKDDPNAVDILVRGRKKNVGLILAHQFIGQLGKDVPEALKGLTAIKFAAKLNDNDCHTLRDEMRCEPEFIRDQPEMTFAAHIRGMDRAVSIVIPKLVMENMPKMTDAEFDAIRAKMREDYCEPHKDRPLPPEPEPEPEPDSPEKKTW